MKHRMKKQPLDFVEVPVSEEAEKKAYVRVSDLPVFLTEDMVRMHFENNFSQISTLEMEGTSAIIVFSANGGEREQNEQVYDYP